MFMLAEKQLAPDEPVCRFWIDPDVEVALNAQINEHYHSELARLVTHDLTHQAHHALMDCYCHEHELISPAPALDMIAQSAEAEKERPAV
jgi:hypothetical protein